jgi:2-polyprenyl-3-methyl-5-hydroxy-6-metoxy-1,4-benzoquinol methylase
MLPPARDAPRPGAFASDSQEVHSVEQTQSPSQVDQVKLGSDIAHKLMHLSDDERRAYYGDAYDQIFAAALATRGDDVMDQRFGADAYMVGHLERLSQPGDTVLEVGCGCGYLALEMARIGRRVIAADVSSVALETARRHAAARRLDIDFRLLGGIGLDLPDESVDLAYSVEVVEHLHERDVPLHLAEVFRVLRPGGFYWLLTPNALQGRNMEERFGVHHHEHAEDEPADVHLKEWTYTELAPLLRRAGFESLASPWRVRHAQSLPPLPVAAKVAVEWLIERAGHRAVRSALLQLGGCLHTTFIARKPAR